MKTALIATIGFDEKFCYRAILRHGIREGDRVILVTGKMIERVEKACDWVQKLLRTSYGDRVAVEVVELDINNVEHSIKTISSLIEELDDYYIVVNLSGGMRALIAIVLLACIKSSKNIKIEIETEDFERLVIISESLIRLIRNPIQKDKLEILKLIANGNQNVRSISNALKKDVTTIRRHISRLEEMGLIVVEKRKPLKIRISKLAEAIL